MGDPRRLLWGAPGPVLAGFPTSDQDRALLLENSRKVTQHWSHPFATELLNELTGLWPEVERMRDAMGPERLAHDVRLTALQRAGAYAAWLLQQENAFLQAFFSPTDPQAESFRPAVALNLGASSVQRRITRMDALRQAYLRHPELPDAANRAEQLAVASARLFRAVTDAREGAVEPVPLAEARQRVDRAYATLRDTVVAQRALDVDLLPHVFLDLSPVWRFARLSLG